MLEPHPVSGEIEVDWEHDVQTRFRRYDPERLEGLVVLKELNLFFRLVYCTGAEDAQGWKVGEVGVAKKLDGSLCELDIFCGYHSISIAEAEYSEEGNKISGSATTEGLNHLGQHSGPTARPEADIEDDDEDDEDDGYWDRYDATPARTPANKRSPAPHSLHKRSLSPASVAANITTEDAYFSRYESVQPAMDNHDPDEEVESPLNSFQYDSLNQFPGNNLRNPEVDNVGKASIANHSSHPSQNRAEAEDTTRHHVDLVHPRPASPASSKGSGSVTRLEEAAENYGVQRHISRSVKNLFLLARSSGMDREEFEELIKRELDALAMVPDDAY